MRRRDFISLVSCGAVWPIVAKAQHAERMRRIGVIFGAGIDADDVDIQSRLGAFQQGLKEAGWIDGQNIRIELRAGAGDADRIREYAKELVTFAPGVISVRAVAICPGASVCC
jgi:putative ABC transport system substrate-binding protein